MEDISKKTKGLGRKVWLLVQAVLPRSRSKDFDTARKEWFVSGYEYADEADGHDCVCTHSGLKHLFEITNMFTGEILFPIGSVCINLFKNKEMDDVVKECERRRSRIDRWGHKVAKRGWLGGKKYKSMPDAYFKYLKTLTRPAPHLADMIAYYDARQTRTYKFPAPKVPVHDSDSKLHPGEKQFWDWLGMS